jgi:homoserine kinase type II
MAVYTEVTDEDLSGLLAAYDLGEVLSFKGIAEGVENSNFLLHTEAGFYILTLYEKRVNAAELPFFLGLMEHLAQHGITCPQPVRDRHGEALGHISGRPAAIVTFLDGVWIRRPEPHHCAALGEALAKLHKAGADFRMHRQNALSLEGWIALYHSAETRADEVAPGLAEAIAAELSHLGGHWPNDLPSGIIHADLFPDNVFFLAGKLSGLIDFYFACNDAFAYDLAICINAWCFEPDGSFNITKGMALINGYERVRKLDGSEVAALPILARGAALRFMLTRLVDWLDVPAGAVVKPKDPIEYVRKLRFHQQVSSAREFGLLR